MTSYCSLEYSEASLDWQQRTHHRDSTVGVGWYWREVLSDKEGTIVSRTFSTTIVPYGRILNYCCTIPRRSAFTMSWLKQLKQVQVFINIYPYY